MQWRHTFLLLLGAALFGPGSLDRACAQATSAAKSPPAAQDAKTPSTRIAGSYGNWTLVCGKEGDPATAEERCSLVLPLIEKETQKLVFRMILVYGPKGNLVLRVDGPTGVALQRGLQVTTDSGKVYGLPFQTCLPMGCKALNVVADDMRKDLRKSKNATIVVYALNGNKIQTVAGLKGLTLGLKALDKKRTALLEQQ